MGLKEGSAEDLMKKGLFTRSEPAVRSLFEQMLRALDYLACKGIIHRDVKPANILYTRLPEGRFLFQLADFGICNILGNSRSSVGSRPFIAPEILSQQGTEQTPKADVWSLFVTLAYARDVNGY